MGLMYLRDTVEAAYVPFGLVPEVLNVIDYDGLRLETKVVL